MEEVQTAIGAFEANPYFWDWITLACVVISVIGFLYGLIWLLGLPGRIAIARNHPDAEAVYTMGWVGFIAIVPWIQALIWAFKPTNKIDIRYFPEQERQSELEALGKLSRYAYGRDLSPEQKAALSPGVSAEDPAPEGKSSEAGGNSLTGKTDPNGTQG